MYKISWGMKSDPLAIAFVIVPDAGVLYAIYHVITGYGRDDGSTPVNVRVTNLDGYEVDMTSRRGSPAALGTYSKGFSI